MNEIENKHRRTVLLMGIALILCMLGSFTLGRYPVSLSELLGVLGSKLGLPIEPFWTSSVEAAVWNIRLPRVILSVLVGACLDLGHLRVCAADLAVDIHRRLHLHRVGHMAVDVKRGRRRHVTDGCRQGFDVHSVFQRHGCEGMAQVVEANALTARTAKDPSEDIARSRGISRRVVILR